MTRNRTHRLLQRFERLPGGLGLFSRAVCLKAPYFATIRPGFTLLRPGLAEASMPLRRRVTNHLGSMHAIAMANLCELLAGTLMEVSIRPDMRWIPGGMDIRYLARARTGVAGRCELPACDWREAQDVNVEVELRDREGQEVARASICMYVSPRR